MQPAIYSLRTGFVVVPTAGTVHFCTTNAVQASTKLIQREYILISVCYSRDLCPKRKENKNIIKSTPKRNHHYQRICVLTTEMFLRRINLKVDAFINGHTRKEQPFIRHYLTL
jgi:hypothetical protein